MKKYYFFSSMYQSYQDGNFRPQTGAIDMHPILYVKHLNDTVANYETILFGWQEITEEEYKMYNISEFLTKQS